MEGELVSDSSSVNGVGVSNDAPIRITYTTTFEKCFPSFLAIGMTYDEYWNGDSSLTRYYLKAEKIRQKRENERAWVQGLYVYHALCDVSPLYAIKPDKPEPYLKEPFDLFPEEKSAKDIEREEKAKMESIRAKFMAKTSNIHKNYEVK